MTTKDKQAKIAELESMHRVLVSTLEETRDNERRLQLIKEINGISDELGALKGHKKINKEEYQINTDIRSADTEASFPEYAPMPKVDIEEARRKLGIGVGSDAYIGMSEQDKITSIKSPSAFKRLYLHIKRYLGKVVK